MISIFLWNWHYLVFLNSDVFLFVCFNYLSNDVQFVTKIYSWFAKRLFQKHHAIFFESENLKSWIFIYFLILVIIRCLLCHTELLGLHYVEPFKFKFWLFFFCFLFIYSFKVCFRRSIPRGSFNIKIQTSPLWKGEGAVIPN